MDFPEAMGAGLLSGPVIHLRPLDSAPQVATMKGTQ